MLSALTPPVAVAALAAAKIAKAGFLETARDAMKLMLTTFVIPFAFVYYPSLMSFPNLKWEVLVPIITCLLCNGRYRSPVTAISVATSAPSNARYSE